MTKKRKSLDDALAREFVYGEKDEQAEPEQVITQNQQEPEPQPQPEPTPIALPTPTPQPTKPSIMSQLQPATPKEATIRLTVDLPESMHQKLSMLAAKTRRKKAEIVRLLLDEALKDVEE
ncbi:CopG family transcriptional regulator [Tolypothrix sp. FACHB-123]|uniref:CopG family transcriptional regulator n=1 Tax=Tolypothrix sp. FACHB-123 TaxID=2692868 RepID=UPI0016840643|nr:CopG family transcriptional regulator [Tolypothrix sp. FACHB-123]MBD2358930.1 CopG family transcriptional regulator [Tolypothrix sp. FACHB-123]